MSPSVSDTGFDRPAAADAWLYIDEITHRTLNDYTAMLSMLRRASAGMSDVTGVAVLDAVSARLRAAAAAYGALRPLRGSLVRNLDDDLECLCASLTSSILADRSIRLTLAAEPVTLSAQRSWQVSLIVSELVMNAAKHAFAGAGGAIVINARADGRMIQCAVIDNGKGSPGYMPGRGSGIVDALAAGLGGQIIRQFSRTGSTVVLRIPRAET
ncbi:MAG TPA: ATP-binding protein [Hyphomonadaceae bacterium]|jgi:two-component sensor histidine kinase|nr:ATP-binding protein [Hyphomonadaceae bacterium]